MLNQKKTNLIWIATKITTSIQKIQEIYSVL